MEALGLAARAAHARSLDLRERTASLLAEADQLVARIRSGEPVAPRAGAEEEIARLLDEVDGLRRALESRAVIEQAKGIIIASAGCDPDAAFRLLVEQSQHENRKLREVAEDLVRSKLRG